MTLYFAQNGRPTTITNCTVEVMCNGKWIKVSDCRMSRRYIKCS